MGDLIIFGNANIENSAIQFNYSDTLINGDLTFIGSSFTIANSSISVDGCVSLKDNTQLTIDVSKYQRIIGKQTTVQLITSKKSCIISL